MPPNNKLEDIVQVALPYIQPLYKLEPQSEDPPVYYQASSSSQELADEEEEEPVLRITTRARITYELDRFPKNEMLIINNKKVDAGKTLCLMHTFQKFKFEFTVIDTEAAGGEIWQKINQFFQKDFSSTGLAAVVTAYSGPDPEDLTPRAHQGLDSEVLDYFMKNAPPSLQGKPKIFINEAPQIAGVPYLLRFPSDILIIQAEKIFHGQETSSSPLDFLCSKLMEMEDTQNILDVLIDVNSHWCKANSPYIRTSRINYLSTLTKELLLEKEGNTDEEWTKKVYSTILEPDMFHLYQRVSKAYQNTWVGDAQLLETASTSSDSNVVDTELQWLRNVLDFVLRNNLDRYNDVDNNVFESGAGMSWKRAIGHPLHPPGPTEHTLVLEV